ncbi:Protein of unknown function [Chryseobacterium piscicola]|uniref:DUF4238 domain-containing protein n=1 Tax=Chryseobacterium piscicola TaxID=551459 RepID=A0A1N7MGB8_9FLAO|nr:DUF4238 domain-containing protein [Chryseobacterium piscicola]PQA98014.1 hypothetical protein B0A70_00040 [Chryseobacterium piscicola]SIS85082.1 Protein of unknown function [Chryseobacterium piscicola]
MQKKKKQHYVWKEYLKNWSINNYINTILLRKNLETKVNLVNTSLENYFYTVPNYSDQDFLEILQIVDDHASEYSRPQIIQIISAIYKNSNLSKHFESTVQDFAELERINMIEDFFTNIEELGKKLIRSNSVQQIIELLKNDAEYSDALFFISFQYVRTKKMKENVLKGIRESNFYKEKYWLIFQIIYGFEIGIGLSIRKKIKLNFLVSKSDYNFITSDNPIFNFLENDKNEDGAVKDMELYYPLNPKIALIISSSDKNEIEETIINEIDIENLNRKVYNNALENIYFFESTDVVNL